MKALLSYSKYAYLMSYNFLIKHAEYRLAQAARLAPALRQAPTAIRLAPAARRPPAARE